MQVQISGVSVCAEKNTSGNIVIDTGVFFGVLILCLAVGSLCMVLVGF